MSKIIVFEGADRAGKFTQTHALQGYLSSKGLSSKVVEVPVRGNPIYHVIYWMLGNGLAKKFPKLFQWFHFLNRKIFQVFTLPSMMGHDYVILDRWSLSTVVYGTAEGVDTRFSETLAAKLIEPDYTILLLGKTHMLKAEDVYESDVSLQHKVKQLYEDWAISNPRVSSIVDSGLSRDEVSEKVKFALRNANIIP